MKSALIIASVASMIDQFNMPNIKLLQELGYEVDVACNYIEGSTCSTEKIQQLKKTLADMRVGCFQIDFARNITKIGQNIRAYRELKEVAKNKDYAMVHCHSPIGGLLGRMVFYKYRKSGTHVMYTAHGFHFYKGAPAINWMMYYPIEKIASGLTDTLITINKEDYKLAEKKMNARKIEYVPGIGIDVSKFSPDVLSVEERKNIRRVLGVADDEKMLLSVGELINRNNHESVIRALADLKNEKWKYFICGEGELHNHLQQLIKELGLEERITILGFRTDASHIYECSDMFIFPSCEEELPIALMEAIASKVSVVCSNITGNMGFVDTDSLFNPYDVKNITIKIKEYLSDDKQMCVAMNYSNLRRFPLETALSDVKDAFKGGVKHLLELYEAQKLRESIDVPIDAFLIFSVGELNSNKNHEIIINSIASINDKRIHYAIAGKGALQDHLIKLAGELCIEEQVHLLGFRDDISKLYRAADLFALPSKREGLSVALMEAISSKIPVITSDIRGNRDLITNNGVGTLCNLSDESEFREAIVYYMNNPCNPTGIPQEYSKKQVLNKMKEIYSLE